MVVTGPTFEDVIAARDRIAPYLQPTPLYRYPPLSRLVGTDVWVKHEDHLPTGAFKVRGGINFVSQLSADERRAGLIAASTGNHAQSVAFAAKLFDVRATICMPECANPSKVQATIDLGANVIHHGVDVDDARERAEELSRSDGYRYVHSGNEPNLIAGVGTATVEILEAEPSIDTIIVPVGGGSGAAGACLVAKAMKPHAMVIGVQSAQAPAGYRSWKSRTLVKDVTGTFAEGLATRTAFALPQQILWEYLHQFVLVDDAEIRSAMRLMIQEARTLAEASAASPLAAALKMREELAGRRVALVCTGRNATLEQIREALIGP